MSDRAANPRRVLVTGSTGAIGQPVSLHLVERGHSVRGFARRPTPNLDDYVMGDLNDRKKVFEAVDGVDTIIHLGAYPNPADFVDVLVQPNVIGLYNILEAAREFDVERLILASTIQVISGHNWPTHSLQIEDGPAPINHYALTKAWSEVAGDMYARTCNMSVLSVRIGWLPRDEGEAKQLAASPIGPDIFFSHEDAKRFHERCVEAPDPARGQSAILFATSRPLHRERVALEPARSLIGYEPQDVWPQGLPYSVEDVV